MVNVACLIPSVSLHPSSWNSWPHKDARLCYFSQVCCLGLSLLVRDSIQLSPTFSMAFSLSLSLALSFSLFFSLYLSDSLCLSLLLASLSAATAPHLPFHGLSFPVSLGNQANEQPNSGNRIPGGRQWKGKSLYYCLQEGCGGCHGLYVSDIYKPILHVP